MSRGLDPFGVFWLYYEKEIARRAWRDGKMTAYDAARAVYEILDERRFPRERAPDRPLAGHLGTTESWSVAE